LWSLAAGVAAPLLLAILEGALTGAPRLAASWSCLCCHVSDSAARADGNCMDPGCSASETRAALAPPLSVNDAQPGCWLPTGPSARSALISCRLPARSVGELGGSGAKRRSGRRVCRVRWRGIGRGAGVGRTDGRTPLRSGCCSAFTVTFKRAKAGLDLGPAGLQRLLVELARSMDTTEALQRRMRFLRWALKVWSGGEREGTSGLLEAGCRVLQRKMRCWRWALQVRSEGERDGTSGQARSSGAVACVGFWSLSAGGGESLCLQWATGCSGDGARTGCSNE